MRCHMKDCFLKLHKVDKSTMDKIVSLALADHDWNNFADTYSSFDENGVRKSPRYVSTISQGIFDTWNENILHQEHWFVSLCCKWKLHPTSWRDKD